MPSFVTEGLILKRRNFGEADRVLTMLTVRCGKISVVARGVRKITSRRSGNVETLNRVKVYLYKAKSYTLTEAESIQTFSGLKSSLPKLTAAMHIVELIDRLVPEGVGNDGVYELSIEALKWLEDFPRQIIVRSYELKLLHLLGFWDSHKLNLSDGEFDQLFDKLLFSDWQDLVKVSIDNAKAVAIERLLGYYIEEVLESKLKSRKVFKVNQPLING